MSSHDSDGTKLLTGLVAPSSAGDDVLVIPIANRVSEFHVIDLLWQVRQRLAREDLEELFINNHGHPAVL